MRSHIFVGLCPSFLESFEGLAIAMSPENLSCDGELDAASIRRRANYYKSRWADLEMQMGRKVTLEDVETALEAESTSAQVSDPVRKRSAPWG